MSAKIVQKNLHHSNMRAWQSYKQHRPPASMEILAKIFSRWKFAVDPNSPRSWPRGVQMFFQQTLECCTHLLIGSFCAYACGDPLQRNDLTPSSDLQCVAAHCSPHTLPSSPFPLPSRSPSAAQLLALPTIEWAEAVDAQILDLAENLK